MHTNLSHKSLDLYMINLFHDQSISFAKLKYLSFYTCANICNKSNLLRLLDHPFNVNTVQPSLVFTSTSINVTSRCLNASNLLFRHEMPTDPNDPLADQNIKDRFYGINDPVAGKLLDRASKLPSLEPPPDKTITTLYVGGLDGKVVDQDLR